MNLFSRWGRTRRLSRPQPLTWTEPSAAPSAPALPSNRNAAFAAPAAADGSRGTFASCGSGTRACVPDPTDELARLMEPTPDLQQLASYRYDEDPRYRERLDDALCLWLTSACADDAGAEMRFDLGADGVRVAFGPAETLTALIPESAWNRIDSACDAPVPAAHAALITGEPCRAPWDALAAWRPASTVCVRVRVWSAGDDAAADRLAALAAADAWLEQAHRTKTVGNETSTLRNPAASAWQARLEQERARVAHAQGMCRIAVLVAAHDARDLDYVSALLMGSMAHGADGAPAPQRRALVRSSSGWRVDGAAHSVTALITFDGALALLRPPTEATAGLTVVNASVGPAARRTFATTGTAAIDTEPSIALGTYETGPSCRIPTGRFAAHVAVTGMPGMGKSSCTSMLLRQLMAQGVHVTVLEPSKCEYQRLLAGAGAFRAHGAGRGMAPLAMNPLAPDPGVRPGLWLQSLVGCMSSALGLDEDPLPLYCEGLLRRLFRRFHIDLEQPADPHTTWPTVQDLLAEVRPYVEKECLASPEIKANVLGALTLRCQHLADEPVFRTQRGLMATDLTAANHVLRLADLGEEAGVFAGMVLLARLAACLPMAEQRPLHTVIALEEAHVLLEDPDTGEPTRFARLYSRLLAESRSAGIGFITVDQRPALLPEGVFSNSVTRICFASTHQRDREAAARSLGLTAFQEQRLGSLPPGQAVVASAGSMGADVVHIATEPRKG